MENIHFLKWIEHLNSHMQCPNVPEFHILVSTCCYLLMIIAILGTSRQVWVVSQMADSIEHFIMCLLVICICSFKSIYQGSFDHFNWIIWGYFIVEF